MERFETTVMIRIVHDAEGGDGRNAWKQAGKLRDMVKFALSQQLENFAKEHGPTEAEVVEVDVTMPRKIKD